MQEAFGYVPEPAIPMIASALSLSRAEVHGVFTFIMISGTNLPAAMC
jgi:formate dehydrogenase subunit gamma